MAQNSDQPVPNLATHSVLPFDFSDVVRVLRRRWLVLAAGLGVGVAAAVAYGLLTPTVYESTAQILVMRKNTQLATSGGKGAEEVDAAVTEDLLSTHMQIVQSPQIVGDALKAHGYDNLPSILNQLGEDEDPVTFVAERMDVTRGGTGQARAAHVLNLGFQHTSGEETRDILDAVVDRYKAFLADKFQDVSKEAAELISQAKVDLAADLEAAEQEYQKFREEAPLLWKGNESSNIHRTRYEEIQAELSQIHIRQSEAKARYEIVADAITNMDTAANAELQLLSLLDDKHVERLGLLLQVETGDANTAAFQATQPARLEKEKAEHEGLLALMLKEKTLLHDLGPQHPQVLETRDQIEVMKSFLGEKADILGTVKDSGRLTPKAIVDAYVSLLRFDMAALDRRQKDLEALAAQESDAARALVAFELRGETLRRQVSLKQDLYDTVLDRLREINLVKDYGGFVTEVISPVQLGKAVWPHWPMVIALGLLLGCMLGFGGAFAVDALDRSFRNSEDVRTSIGLPVLTHLPNLKTTVAMKAGLPPTGASAKLAPTLLAFHRPRSREAEVFRTLRTSLLFSTQGREHTVLSCTSANEGDGKSTLIANLAVSIAQTGRKVLLVDGDLRRPTLHTFFGLENERGLSDIISGSYDPPEVIQKSEVPFLHLLPSGAIPSNPAEMLTSGNFGDFLQSIKEQYDFVLVDSPPVLAVADPCIIAQHVDGMILAVRIARDTRPQCLRTKEMLLGVGANLLGIVVNGADPGTHYDEGYGYGYNYSAGYHQNGSSKYFSEADRETSSASR